MLKFLRIDKSKGRIHKENNKIDDFQHDAMKVIYSSNFRKLEYKTQVFFNNADDYYRTRLTHTLEVVHISKMICNILGLNSDLVEVISLIHDIGHTPFGHSGEDGLNEILQKYQYPIFNHNIQSIRVVDLLSSMSNEFDGLNLTYEVIDGLLKHNGPIEKTENKYLLDVAQRYKIDLTIQASLEAQISSISDDIAYINHDIEDGYRSGLLSFDEIVSLPIMGDFVKKEYDFNPQNLKKMILREAINRSRQFMIENVIKNIYENVTKYQVKSLNDFYKVNKNFATFSDDALKEKIALKKIIFDNLYKNNELLITSYKMKNVVKDLFEFYLFNENCMPDDWREKIKKCDNKKSLVICDFIAGMTDRYSLYLHDRIFH
jgi:dGTPase